jgi:hypothetical protein
MSKFYIHRPMHKNNYWKLLRRIESNGFCIVKKDQSVLATWMKEMYQYRIVDRVCGDTNGRIPVRDSYIYTAGKNFKNYLINKIKEPKWKEGRRR